MEGGEPLNEKISVFSTYAPAILIASAISAAYCLQKIEFPVVVMPQTTSNFVVSANKINSKELSPKVFEPKTKLGKKLWELRQQIVASGETLLPAKQLIEELYHSRK